MHIAFSFSSMLQTMKDEVGWLITRDTTYIRRESLEIKLHTQNFRIFINSHNSTNIIKIPTV